MYHKLELIGRVGRDPEMRFSPDGKAITSFSVAVNAGYGEHKKTLWVRVSAFTKLAEHCNEYLHKGSLVHVTGALNFDGASGGPKLWERKDGTQGTSYELIAQGVTFLDSKNGENNDEAVF